MKQLRVVGLGNWDNYLSYFLMGSQEGAIRNGAWFRAVQLINKDYKTIESQIDFFKPHIIVCHMIFNAKPAGFRDNIFSILRDQRKKGVVVFYHMGDARTKPRYPADISDIVDCVLINNLLGKEWSEKWWMVPTIHWPYMCLYQKDWDNYDSRYAAEICFTGGLSKQEGHHHSGRTNFIDQLRQKGFKIRQFPDEKLGNSRFQTPEVSASSECVLGFQMGREIKGYQDVRPFQYAGSGALYFHDTHENMRQFFAPDKHYVEFDGIDDFVEKFIANVAIKKGIRQDGFEYAQKYHSSKVRMKAVIDFYNGREPEPVKLLGG